MCICLLFILLYDRFKGCHNIISCVLFTSEIFSLSYTLYNTSYIIIHFLYVWVLYVCVCMWFDSSNKIKMKIIWQFLMNEWEVVLKSWNVEMQFLFYFLSFIKYCREMFRCLLSFSCNFLLFFKKRLESEWIGQYLKS